MVRRKYRCVIEVEIRLQEVTERLPEKRTIQREALPELGWAEKSVHRIADFAHQRALQQQLLNMPEILEPWLRRAAILALQHGDVLDAFNSEYVADEVLLRPVVEKLPPASRHLFREASARGELVEAAETVFDAVHSRVLGINLEEVRD